MRNMNLCMASVPMQFVVQCQETIVFDKTHLCATLKVAAHIAALKRRDRNGIWAEVGMRVFHVLRPRRRSVPIVNLIPPIHLGTGTQLSKEQEKKKNPNLLYLREKLNTDLE